MSKNIYFILLILLTVFILSACSKGVIMKKPINLTEYVTKECGTEPAFQNEYWNEHRAGIYVDVNTGEPLFTSLDKFDSGSGWPSFTKPINHTSISKKTDNTLGMKRTEVRTNASHLGHVFDDGPNGQDRYCINSAALKFIPYEDLEKNGYSNLTSLFQFDTAILAGGCFWGVEKILQDLPGVISAVSGYTGGNVKNPTYEQVSLGLTGHAEAVKITFDQNIITYKELLEYFWRLHNPTEVNKQGPDVGTQYRSVIFYNNKVQQRIAEESKKEFDLKKVFNKPAATQIVQATTFYPAESYHQDYFDKHPGLTCHALRKE